MLHKIIVIDDEFKKRKKHYINLAKQISKIDSSFSLDLEFVENPSQLHIMLLNNNYSGAIVDAVLNLEWDNFYVSHALDILGTEIPIGIISDKWDQTNTEQINEALKRTNCRTFLHWRDIDKKGKGQIDYAIRSIQNMIADHLNLDLQYKLAPDEPIKILHISDVQTGGVDDKALKLEANRCADSIIEELNDSSPTFIAFTGDVAEHGTPSQYLKAIEWIRYFLKRLKMNDLPARNLLYVPGNHDVNLNIAAGARVKLIKNKKTKKEKYHLTDDIQHEDIINYAYTPFRDFLNTLVPVHRDELVNIIQSTQDQVFAL